MDGFSSNSGVIVMAATNRPETLDPALLRPGRFDRHVLVDRPDIRGREDILKVHIKKVKIDSEVSLKDVAGITSGFVGADLANLVNEAALLAARKSKRNRDHGRVQRGRGTRHRRLGEAPADHARRGEDPRGLSRKRPRSGCSLPAQHRPGPQSLDHSPRPGGPGLHHCNGPRATATS